MRPRIHIVAATLLALLAAGLISAFPHDHAPAQAEAVTTARHGHAPHHDSRLERHGLPDQGSDCAICFFQRVLSQAPTAEHHAGPALLPHAPLSIPSDEIVLVDVAFVAEPRAPPVA